MLYFILILLLVNTLSTIEESQRSTTLKSQRKKTFASVVFTSGNNYAPSDKKPCQWLRRLKHQSKFCWKRRGIADTLLQAKWLSVSNCQTLFEFEQWNCSKRELFFKNIYRETAFMYSIASSSLMFSLARACSDNKIAGCTCGNPGKIPNSSNFQWKGCSDNVKFAKKFTRKFLQLRKKGDSFNAVVKYNMEVGIKVVLDVFENEIKCKCHGLSASCTLKTCYKQFKSFDPIAKKLKELYHTADQIQPQNDFRSFKKDKHARKLLYLENGPNFCQSTVGRRCNNTENCATLCCGRVPYSTEITVKNDNCNCRFNETIFNVTCQTCREKKTIFICT